MRKPRALCDDRREDGVVFIGILVFLTLVSLAAAVEFPSMLGQQNRRRQGEGERRVQELARAAEEVYRLKAQYPADLDQLLQQGNYPMRERRDPFVPSLDLSYRNLGASLDLRVRGLDGKLGGSDDIIERRDNRLGGRSWTRNRLRLLRAMTYRSAYLSPLTLTAADRAEIRRRLRIRTLAMRRRTYVSWAEAQSLSANILGEEAGIRAILNGHRTTGTFTEATGTQGLLNYLGLPDRLGGDGFGRSLQADDFGFLALGRDGMRNSNDDF